MRNLNQEKNPDKNRITGDIQLQVGEKIVCAAVKNLGIYFDTSLTMEK